MYCYLTHNYRDLTHAGNISKNYIEHIMRGMGFRNVGIPQTHFHNHIAGFFATLVGVAVFPLRIHRGEYLVLQYPIKKYYSYICRMAHLRGAHVITLVHDLGSCRRKKLTPQKEIRRLSGSDCLIIHNDNMKQWLLERGYSNPLIIHHMFDYLADADSPVHKLGQNGSMKRVMYAGALSEHKNAFLYKLASSPTAYRIDLYGRGFDASRCANPNMHYHGFAKDTELISHSKSDFGLVWDGDSLMACQGAFGGYLELNNPIKTSLYLRCHMPVIVWQRAAIAKFVKEKGLGLVVSDIATLAETLAAVTPEQYSEMEQRVVAWSEELRRGRCTRDAIVEALAQLGETYKEPANAAKSN